MRDLLCLPERPPDRRRKRFVSYWTSSIGQKKEKLSFSTECQRRATVLKPTAHAAIYTPAAVLIGQLVRFAGHAAAKAFRVDLIDFDFRPIDFAQVHDSLFFFSYWLSIDRIRFRTEKNRMCVYACVCASVFAVVCTRMWVERDKLVPHARSEDFFFAGLSKHGIDLAIFLD